MTEQERLISAYLKDEAKLYQDWYQTLSPEADSTMRQVAKMPSLAELKAMAQNWSRQWYEKNRQALKKALSSIPELARTVCEKWKRVRAFDDFAEWQLLITHVATAIAEGGVHYDQTYLYLMATVLVFNGLLDWVCEDKDWQELEPAWVM